MVQAMLDDFAPGNYRFIAGPFQYSAGVAALPGYGIERVRFRDPIPLARGFALAAEMIRAAADGVLRLRVALPCTFQRTGFPQF